MQITTINSGIYNNFNQNIDKFKTPKTEYKIHFKGISAEVVSKDSFKKYMVGRKFYKELCNAFNFPNSDINKYYLSCMNSDGNISKEAANFFKYCCGSLFKKIPIFGNKNDKKLIFYGDDYIANLLESCKDADGNHNINNLKKAKELYDTLDDENLIEILNSYKLKDGVCSFADKRLYLQLQDFCDFGMSKGNYKNWYSIIQKFGKGKIEFMEKFSNNFPEVTYSYRDVSYDNYRDFFNRIEEFDKEDLEKIALYYIEHFNSFECENPYDFNKELDSVINIVKNQKSKQKNNLQPTNTNIKEKRTIFLEEENLDCILSSKAPEWVKKLKEYSQGIEGKKVLVEKLVPFIEECRNSNSPAGEWQELTFDICVKNDGYIDWNVIHDIWRSIVVLDGSMFNLGSQATKYMLSQFKNSDGIYTETVINAIRKTINDLKHDPYKVLGTNFDDQNIEDRDFNYITNNFKKAIKGDIQKNIAKAILNVDKNKIYSPDYLIELIKKMDKNETLNSKTFEQVLDDDGNTLLMLITNIPQEHPKYSELLEILKLQDINYNQKNKFDISFLEQVMYSENFKLLALIKDKNLEYTDMLDYTYNGITDNKFKEKIKNMNINFTDLLKTADVVSLDMFKKLEYQLNSPLCDKSRLLGQIWTKVRISNLPESKNFCNYLIDKYYSEIKQLRN